MLVLLTLIDNGTQILVVFAACVLISNYYPLSGKLRNLSYFNIKAQHNISFLYCDR
jgi:hypothetical protein